MQVISSMQQRRKEAAGRRSAAGQSVRKFHLRLSGPQTSASLRARETDRDLTDPLVMSLSCHNCTRTLGGTNFRPGTNKERKVSRVLHGHRQSYLSGNMWIHFIHDFVLVFFLPKIKHTSAHGIDIPDFRRGKWLYYTSKKTQN